MKLERVATLGLYFQADSISIQRNRMLEVLLAGHIIGQGMMGTSYQRAIRC